MGLTTFNITELGVFSATILASFALLVKQIQNSRCKSIRCCCGLTRCEREVPISPPVKERDLESNTPIEIIEN